MNYDDQIRYYCQRHNLTEGDAEFFVGMFRQAISEEREACARIAEGKADVYNLGNCIAAEIRKRGDHASS